MAVAQELERLKKLLGKELTLHEIAKLMDVNEQTITREIRRHKLQDYRISLSDSGVLSSTKRLQSESHAIMSTIREQLSSPEVLSAMPLSSKIAWYKVLAITNGISFDKQRLIEGKSTANVSVRSIHRDLEERKEALIAKMERARSFEGEQESL
jgi:IS30 family transposase